MEGLCPVAHIVPSVWQNAWHTINSQQLLASETTHTEVQVLRRGRKWLSREDGALGKMYRDLGSKHQIEVF